MDPSAVLCHLGSYRGLPVLHRLILSLLLLLAGAVPSQAAGPSLLFDPATGEVLSQDRAGEPWYPASLTKLMTAYVVFGKLKSGLLKLDQKLTVSEVAQCAATGEFGVRAGGTVSVDFALQALLVYSANDMAYVLAEGSSGSVTAFAQEMNAQAQRLA